MISDSDLKTGLWVKITGYVKNPEWNGITGYLLAREDERRWVACFPGLQREWNSCTFAMPLKYLTPLAQSRTDVKFVAGAWIQVSHEASADLAGVACKALEPVGDDQWLVAPVCGGQDVARSVPTSMLMPVIPAGMRMARHFPVAASTTSFSWMC
jgi:hypothetical protein